jgi:glycine/D-amino acid oxidase-like deaminating enzyme
VLETAHGTIRADRVVIATGYSRRISSRCTRGFGCSRRMSSRRGR